MTNLEDFEDWGILSVLLSIYYIFIIKNIYNLTRYDKQQQEGGFNIYF